MDVIGQRSQMKHSYIWYTPLDRTVFEILRLKLDLGHVHMLI